MAYVPLSQAQSQFIGGSAAKPSGGVAGGYVPLSQSQSGFLSQAPKPKTVSKPIAKPTPVAQKPSIFKSAAKDFTSNVATGAKVAAEGIRGIFTPVGGKPQAIKMPKPEVIEKIKIQPGTLEKLKVGQKLPGFEPTGKPVIKKPDKTNLLDSLFETKQNTSAQLNEQTKKFIREAPGLRDKRIQKEIERVTRTELRPGYKEPGIGGQFVESFKQSTAQALSGMGATLEMIGNMSGMVLLGDAGGRIRERWKKTVVSNPEWNEPSEGLKYTDPKKYSRLLGGAVPSLLGGVATGVAATLASGGNVGVGVAATVGYGFALEGGSAYQEAKDKGVKEEKAQEYGTAVGAINGILEAILPAKYLKKIGTPVYKDVSKSLMKTIVNEAKKRGIKVLENGTIEGSTEVIQQFVSNAVAKNYEKNRKLWDGMLDSFLGGFMSGGGLGAVEGDGALAPDIPTTNQKGGVVEFTPEQAQAVVVGSNLENTPLGKEIIKTAIQGQQEGKNIILDLKVGADGELKTPGGVVANAVELVDPNEDTTAKTTVETTVPLDLIDTNLSEMVASKVKTDTPKIKEIEESIKAGRPIPAIPVYAENGRYILNSDGFNRHQAYKNLGIQDIPVRIEPKTELTGRGKQLEENGNDANAGLYDTSKDIPVYRGEYTRKQELNNSISTSLNKDVAKSFSEDGNVKEMLIDKNAKIIDISELRKKILGVDKLPDPKTLTSEQFDSITGDNLINQAKKMGYDVIDKTKANIKSSGIKRGTIRDEAELQIVNPKVLKDSHVAEQPIADTSKFVSKEGADVGTIKDFPEITNRKWYRGEDQFNGKSGDKFASTDVHTAAEYGKVRELTPDEIPQNPLVINGSKENFMSEIGYKEGKWGTPFAELKDLPREESYDYLIKKYAQDRGHDGVIYTAGTFEQPELVKFGSKQPIPDIDAPEARIFDKQGNEITDKKIKVLTGKQVEAIRDIIRDKFIQIKENSKSPEEYHTGVKDIIKYVRERADNDKQVLSAFRTELNQEMFGFAGEGNYKDQFRTLQGLKLDPELGPLIETMDAEILAIDELLLTSALNPAKRSQPSFVEQKVVDLKTDKPKTVRQQLGAGDSKETPVGTGRTRNSRLFERIKETLGEEYENTEVKYNVLDLEKQAEAVTDLIENDPDGAIKVARGLVEPAPGMTQNAVAVGLAHLAQTQADMKMAAEMWTKTSLRATRLGQEIVSLRGSFGPDSPMNAVRQIIDYRIEKVAKRYKGIAEKFNVIKKASAIKKVDAVVKEQATKLKKQMTEQQKRIQSAQEIINALTCK